MEPRGRPFSHPVCASPSAGRARLSGRLLAHVDEVARRLRLAGDVRLEVSVDVVLHFAAEGLVQKGFEVLQTVRVVGQTEFTAKDKDEEGVKSLPDTETRVFCCFLF